MATRISNEKEFFFHEAHHAIEAVVFIHRREIMRFVHYLCARFSTILSFPGHFNFIILIRIYTITS